MLLLVFVGLWIAAGVMLTGMSMLTVSYNGLELIVSVLLGPSIAVFGVGLGVEKPRKSCYRCHKRG